MGFGDGIPNLDGVVVVGMTVILSRISVDSSDTLHEPVDDAADELEPPVDPPPVCTEDIIVELINGKPIS